MDWLNSMGTLLNSRIQKEVGVAQKANLPVTYVPASVKFKGHSLCDRDIPYLNEVVLDAGIPPSALSESFHPSVVGQALGYLPAFKKLVKP